MCAVFSCLHTQASPEGAPLHILPAESHVDAFLEEGAKGHVLPEGPVHLPVLHQLGSTAQDPGHTWGTHTHTQKTLSILIILKSMSISVAGVTFVRLS